MEAESFFAEEPHARYVDRRRKVWLACNGEPHDFRSVLVVRLEVAAGDVQIVNFICPRCGEQEQSLLFC